MCESRHHGGHAGFGMGLGFRLGGPDISDRLQEPPVVEPVDPFEGGELDRLEAAPRSPASDQLGLEEPDDALGQRVVVAVADAADRPDRSERRFGMLITTSFAEVLRRTLESTQYTSEPSRRLMADNGVTCSMSRSGNVWDNAAMESFFSSLKTERVHQKVYRTRDAARADVFDYVERFYTTRRHSTVGYLSPVEFERRITLA